MSQTKVVATLKLVLLISIFALVLAFIERLPYRISRVFRYFDEARWWPPIEKEIEKFSYEMDPRKEHYEDRNLDWDEQAYMERGKRRARRRKVASLTRPVILVTRSIANYFWPLGLAAIAWFQPSLLLVLH